MTEVDRSRLEVVEATIGPRQTVDIVIVPGLGRGRLVFDHGPKLFICDEPPVAYRVERLGSSGSSNVSGSWHEVVFPGQPKITAKQLTHGTRHDRYYSTILGDGWLVTEAKGEVPGYWYRFESMEGEVKLRFNMIALGVGRPDYYEKMSRARTRMPKMDDPDEENWTTFVTTSGERFAFRRKGPPPEKGDPKVLRKQFGENEMEQTSLFPEKKT